jgi:peptidoglycan/xylan/chitin deacetylase (PgdA/CDA1 family)
MPTSVVNITVHGVGDPVRTLDPGEDATWVTVEQLERALDAAAGRDDVCITFDDGNASDLEIGLPHLVERGLTAHFFVLAGELGKPGRLDADGVRQLRQAGMSVGSHGWAHRNWRSLTDAEARQEIVEANQIIGDITGQPVTAVAIPFGSYDRVVLARLRRAGVRLVYTSDGGTARRGQWLQARNSLRHDLDTAWVRQVFNGKASPIVRARRIVARRVKQLRGPS